MAKKGSKNKKSTKPRTKETFPPLPPPLVQEEVDVDEWIIRCSTSGGPPKRKVPCLEECEQSSRLVLLLGRDLDPQAVIPKYLPSFRLFTPIESLRSLGDIIGVDDFKTNLSSFWMLDVLSEIVYQCQLNGMRKKNQKMTVIWILFILKYIVVYAPSREEMFTIIDQMLRITGERIIEGRKTFLHPKLLMKKVEVYLKKIQTAQNKLDLCIQPDRDKSKKEFLENEKKGEDVLINLESDDLSAHDQSTDSGGEYEGYLNENRLSDLLYLAETLYKLFANRFIYEVVRGTYSKPPEIIPVQILQMFNLPKPYQSPHPKLVEGAEEGKAGKTKRKEKNKKEKKGKKNKKSGKKPTEPNLPEFLKRPTLEEKKIRMLEAERKMLKDSYILSLVDAVDEKFFQRLFPEPPQVEKKEKGRKASKNKAKKKKKK